MNKVQRPAERVAIVDDKNNYVGTTTRAQMRAENLIHRCSFVAIFNSQVRKDVVIYHSIMLPMVCCPQGRLYVQKRVSHKETYPSYYDPAPGGVVGEVWHRLHWQSRLGLIRSVLSTDRPVTILLTAGTDESYEQSAEREIEEEMGVRQVVLQNCFDFFHADDTSKVWGRLFTCTYDGPFTLDPEEVESGEFMTVQVLHMLHIICCSLHKACGSTSATGLCCAYRFLACQVFTFLVPKQLFEITQRYTAS